MQKGKYKIESDKATAAGIINKDGKLFYSSNYPFTITVPYKVSTADGKKVSLFYYADGTFVEAKSSINTDVKTVTARLPAGYDVALKIEYLK